MKNYTLVNCEHCGTQINGLLDMPETWECPACGKSNRTKQVSDVTECPNCGRFRNSWKHDETCPGPYGDDEYDDTGDPIFDRSVAGDRR